MRTPIELIEDHVTQVVDSPIPAAWSCVRRSTARSQRWLILVLTGISISAAACSKLTKITSPDTTSPQSLHDSAGALILRAGAIQAFTDAFGTQAVITGLIADEFSSVGSAGAQEDRRVPLQQSLFPYNTLSSTRNGALVANAALAQYARTPSWHRAELLAYVGYTEVMLAEDMCSGVPLAAVTTDGVTPGPGYTTTQLLTRAVADFDSAAHYALDSDSIRNLVRVGKARALLDAAGFSAAEAVADSVPVEFTHQLAFDGINDQNQAYGYFNGQLMTVSDREGGNGIDFVSSGDPRISLVANGTAPNGDSVLVFAPYDVATAPFRLASGIEARLIAAEALLPANGGVGHAWLDTLNALRSVEGGVAGLAPLLDPGSDTARVSLVFRERALWLFGTGHRQGDMRRLIRQYGRPTESVFPTGVYQHSAERYGTATEFASYGEQANPYYHGCVSVAP